MRSAAAPAATVLTVITVVVMPVFAHNHWVRMIVGKQTTVTNVVCVNGARCPKTATLTETVVVHGASPAAIAKAEKAGATRGKADFAKKHKAKPVVSKKRK
jgi:hypothetical protein